MNLQKHEKSKNHAEIMRINKQIEALERQRDKLFDEDSKLERDAKEKAWKDQNAEAISFCKKLVGKAFTFGPKVIKHHNPFGGPTGYDYVNVYFPLCIDYVDKYNVHLYCRQMVNDEHAVSLTGRHSMTLRVSYLDGTYKPSEHEIYHGAVHILTDGELKIAFEFWLKKQMTYLLTSSPRIRRNLGNVRLIWTSIGCSIQRKKKKKPRMPKRKKFLKNAKLYFRHGKCITDC